MINSRSLDDLHPYVKYLAEELIRYCNNAGIDIIVISTYRDIESQNSLYAQGRTKPGNKVTNAKGGQSFHNWQVAFDVVPLKAGKPIWDTSGPNAKVWQTIGKLGVDLGLEWAGNWKTFKEFPHFQFTAGLTCADFQAGKTLDDVIEITYDYGDENPPTEGQQ
jgi:peptidoglycan L-alanyl-D-glutamate endopeptidase CwlK